MCPRDVNLSICINIHPRTDARAEVERAAAPIKGRLGADARPVALGLDLCCGVLLFDMVCASIHTEGRRHSKHPRDVYILFCTGTHHGARADEDGHAQEGDELAGRPRGLRHAYDFVLGVGIEWVCEYIYRGRSACACGVLPAHQNTATPARTGLDHHAPAEGDDGPDARAGEERHVRVEADAGEDHDATAAEDAVAGGLG